MDYKAIQELIKTINESGLYSLEVESEGTRIKMSKGPEQVLVGNTGTTQEVPVRVHEEVQPVTETETCQPEIVEKLESIENENLHVIKSPIVGTFYASASPEKPDFVNIGAIVKKGSVLCILEAMKLMNEIESDIDGEIVEILVKSEDMVEYGQPLFKIRENGK
jgi:acetyl-CoA carboxylase biotin carboxyl carrier protein